MHLILKLKCRNEILNGTVEHFSRRAKKYHLKFDGLLPKVKGGYKFVFSTEIDGKTVAQTIREFECTEL